MYLAHHLVLVSSTYHFRMRVPVAVRPAFGCRYIKKSLGTGNITLAKEAAYVLSAACLQQFRKGQGMSNKQDWLKALNWQDEVFGKRSLTQKLDIDIDAFKLGLMPNGRPMILEATPEEMPAAERALALARDDAALPSVVSPQPVPTTAQTSSLPPVAAVPGKLLSDAIRWYDEKMSPKMLRRSLRKEVKGLEEFLAFHKDCDVPTIDRYHLDNFRSHLQTARANSTPTVKNKFSALKKMFDQLKSAGFYPKENPAAGQITYSRKEKMRRQRSFGKLPFSAEELGLIFEPSAFLASDNPTNYWAPLMQLYTGCRINEICQLSLQDFCTVDGYACVRITDEGEEGSVKTEATKRTLPLHPNLLALGVMDYVAAIKSETFRNSRIFPHMNHNANRFGGAQTKDFTAYLQSVGVDTKNGRKGSHSFRSTVVQKMQDHRVAAEIRKSYVGHTSLDAQSEIDDSHSKYMRETKMQEFASIVHPALDFELPVQGLNVDQSRFIGFLHGALAKKPRQKRQPV